MLLANGIIPRPVAVRLSSPNQAVVEEKPEVDQKTAAQIRRLEVRIRTRIAEGTVPNNATQLTPLTPQARLRSLKSKAATVPSSGMGNTLTPSRHKRRARSAHIPHDAEVIDLTAL